LDCPPCLKWDGDAETAPCHESQKPPLLSENVEPFELWMILNQFGRDLGFGISPIRLEAVMSLLECLGQTRESLEKILCIEKEIYPRLLEKTARQNQKT